MVACKSLNDRRLLFWSKRGRFAALLSRTHERATTKVQHSSLWQLWDDSDGLVRIATFEPFIIYRSGYVVIRKPTLYREVSVVRG